MKELVTSLVENMAQFQIEAVTQVEKGNQSAGKRARKLSLVIEKALKEFRKLSIEDGKKEE